MPIDELRDAVVKSLMSDHDYLIDDAEEEVARSTVEDPEMWHDEAKPADIAKIIAESVDEE